MLKTIPIFGDQSLGKLMVELSEDLPDLVQSPQRIQVISLLRERYWGDLMYEAMSPEEVIKAIIKELESAGGEK